MTERAAPGAPVATLLPGRGYGPQAPLLYYTRLLLRGRGWAVRTVDWDKVPGLDPADPAAVAAFAGEVLATADPARDLVVAKSLGSLALPAAAARGVPGICGGPHCWASRTCAGPRLARPRRRC